MARIGVFCTRLTYGSQVSGDTEEALSLIRGLRAAFGTENVPVMQMNGRGKPLKNDLPLENHHFFNNRDTKIFSTVAAMQALELDAVVVAPAGPISEYSHALKHRREKQLEAHQKWFRYIEACGWPYFVGCFGENDPKYYVIYENVDTGHFRGVIHSYDAIFDHVQKTYPKCAGLSYQGFWFTERTAEFLPKKRKLIVSTCRIIPLYRPDYFSAVAPDLAALGFECKSHGVISAYHFYKANCIESPHWTCTGYYDNRTLHLLVGEATYHWGYMRSDSKRSPTPNRLTTSTAQALQYACIPILNSESDVPGFEDMVNAVCIDRDLATLPGKLKYLDEHPAIRLVMAKNAFRTMNEQFNAAEKVDELKKYVVERL